MAERLLEILQNKFGFSSFRPYQEAVIRSACAGEDSLLVMPTGAGKSLCYQLPGLALGGTTLIISPLIALMEDQIEKMKAKGLWAERIHSGRDRLESRQVCYEYLEGKLDYLYIAPERLGVPNFPEMLARRRPALIAIDEAHCISHWGHDFRPDYRRLKERLALLKPTPIMAVTATATELVQDDIVKQLGLSDARRFIHGFRRDNIGIEVVEMTPGERPEKVLALLADPQRRPAIVYSPTRKVCEQVAELLKTKLKADAYHAGLAPGRRDDVQEAFLSGRIEVVVATVAFGMGIDKANVRTVIHTALPASLENYYQEIGRAGRDGKPSRAILLQSFSDRRTHEFFQERDYPPAATLRQIFTASTEKPAPKDDLREATQIAPDTFDAALEKLWIHQGVQVDYLENVARGTADWEKPYEAQRRHKALQVELISDYARSASCRMQYLVRHFGDEVGVPCGKCDFCAEDACVATIYRRASDEETAGVAAVYEALIAHDGLTIGQLHQRTESAHRLDRNDFEYLLQGLARADLVQLTADAFEKDGRLIQFQRVRFTAKGKKAAGFDASAFRIREAPKKKVKKEKRPRAEKKAAEVGALEGSELETFKKLREWRLGEAKQRQIPAFCILSDRVMRSIAQAKPTCEEELLQIKGFGPKLMEKHGAPILATIND